MNFTIYSLNIMSKMSNLAIDKQNEVVDLYKEHRFHTRYESKCSECFKLDAFWSKISCDDENKLEEAFMEEREVDGYAITKDNCEDLFESWSQNLSMEEIKEILKEKECACKMCKDKGYITKTEWGDTDTDYEVEMECICQED